MTGRNFKVIFLNNPHSSELIANFQFTKESKEIFQKSNQLKLKLNIINNIKFPSKKLIRNFPKIAANLRSMTQHKIC
jgi:hypothetical protein